MNLSVNFNRLQHLRDKVRLVQIRAHARVGMCVYATGTQDGRLKVVPRLNSVSVLKLCLLLSFFQFQLKMQNLKDFSKHEHSFSKQMEVRK